MFRKHLGTFALLLLCVVHLVYVFELRAEFDGGAGRPIFSFGSASSHYDELERDRSAHKAEVVPSSPEPAAPIPADIPAAPEPAPAADAAPPRPSLDWPRFRGPEMDGRYPGEIELEWPETGLPLLYRQPIGGGYASFVVAKGTAFTIEQRRDQEVAAAYDLESGRELWRGALPESAKATPMSYRLASGEQYVAVAVGGGGAWGEGDYVLAFRLRK